LSRVNRVLLPYRNAKKLKAYQAAAEAAGIEAVPAFLGGPVQLKDVAGLLLMGGTDVDPRCYGEEPVPETDVPDQERDRVELDLIHQAIEKDFPIFAICRGLQILNVYHGGSLIQHLPNHPHHDPDPDDLDTSASVHDVVMEENSKLAEIAGTLTWDVNSRHHQAVKALGRDLVVSARDPEDGTIEGLERRDRTFVVAVQWHPEDQVFAHPHQLKLFERFADVVG
jgi:putative glutamine amidotransferase